MTYSCATCACTSTTPGTCHGKPMESYDTVNANALAVAEGDPVLGTLVFAGLGFTRGKGRS